MKGSLLLAFALLSTVGVAQVTTQGQIPPAGAPPVSPPGVPPDLPDQPQPNQPTGFPNPPRTGQLPPAEAGSAQDPFIHIVGGSGNRSKDRVSITGGAQILYRGYQLFADRIDGDMKTNVFVASGSVRLFGVDETVVGERIEIDFNNNTFVATDADAVVHPSAIGPDAKADVFLKGGLTYGSKRRIFGEHSAFTTCDKEKPHFELVADRTDYRPDKRVVLRKVRVKLFGRTILKVPFLSIPLNQPNYKYMPEVGYADDLGYFIKTRFGLYNHNLNNFDGRFEYYSKLGVGVGGDYDYANKNDYGFFHFFTVEGAHPLIDVSQDDKRTFRWGTLEIQNTYNKTDFLNAPQNTTLNSRVNIFLPQGKSSTNISMFRSSNETSTYNTLSETFGISDSRVYSSKFRTTIDVNLLNNESTFSTGDPVKREELDVRFKADEDLDRANLNFTYQRSIPIGSSEGFFSSSDLTPVVSLNTTSQKLFDTRNRFYLPFSAELSLGQFVDPVSRGELTRTDYNMRFSHADPPTKRLKFDFNGRFDQGIYSDGTAQYTLNALPTLSYRLGAGSAATVRYAYLRPYGYAPLQIDRSGQTNLVSADVSFHPQRYVLLAGQTGYDLLELQQHLPTAYQQLSVRAEIQPKQYIALRTLATYDPSQGAWSNIRFDLAYKPGATFVSAGANYDGIRKTWGALNLFVDAFKVGRLKVSTILDYNGYLKQFEARHFQFTYDLHCAEAVLTIIDNPVGFQAGRQVSFFIRLKAFPMNSPFGVGGQGQPLNTGPPLGQ